MPLQEVLPKYRQVTQAYFSAVTALGMRLLRLLALALDLPAEHFDPMFSKPMLFLRPLHYAPRKSHPDQVRIGTCSSSAGSGSRLFSHFVMCPVVSCRCSNFTARAIGVHPDGTLLQGIFGAGAHSDYGMLTLLKTDQHPGLQIWSKGQFVDVPPRDGMFIVNLGDMLERWPYRPSSMVAVLLPCIP